MFTAAHYCWFIVDVVRFIADLILCNHYLKMWKRQRFCLFTFFIYEYTKSKISVGQVSWRVTANIRPIYEHKINWIVHLHHWRSWDFYSLCLYIYSSLHLAISFNIFSNVRSGSTYVLNNNHIFCTCIIFKICSWLNLINLNFGFPVQRVIYYS